jgi:HSP20 family protein
MTVVRPGFPAAGPRTEYKSIKEHLSMADTKLQTQKDRSEQTTPERTRGGFFFTPQVDIFENEKELTVFADMPGVHGDDVDLRYENGELVLHGRWRPHEHQGNFLLREYEEGDFYRVFHIHESIDSTKITASCKNGVLTIHLPKVEAAQPRQIKVRDQ